MTTNAQAALAAAAVNFQPTAQIYSGRAYPTVSPLSYNDNERILKLAQSYLRWLDFQDKEQAAKKELETKGSIEERLERIEDRLKPTSGIDNRSVRSS